MQFSEEVNEELTDWEEGLESCDEDEYIQPENLDQISDHFAVNSVGKNSLTLIKPTLEQAKQALINRLTWQFWSNFHRYHCQKSRLDIDVMTYGHVCELTTGTLKRVMKRKMQIHWLFVLTMVLSMMAGDLSGSEQRLTLPKCSKQNQNLLAHIASTILESTVYPTGVLVH
jgi:hypothetical protein